MLHFEGTSHCSCPINHQSCQICFRCGRCKGCGKPRSKDWPIGYNNIPGLNVVSCHKCMPRDGQVEYMESI